jgi:diadenosine tetraphosphate (Ap4A) HIT family hydrolase
MTFKLNEILERDSHYVASFKLCQIRLIDNADYPWFLLVPKRNDMVEITDLAEEDFDQLNQEIRKIAKILKNELRADKLNIAMIGNIVPQLHVHVIARFKNDKLFPRTVWGHALTRYDSAVLESKIAEFQKIFAG